MPPGSTHAHPSFSQRGISINAGMPQLPYPGQHLHRATAPSGIRTPDHQSPLNRSHMYEPSHGQHPDLMHGIGVEEDEADGDETESIPDIPLRSLASRLDVARLVADGHIVQDEEDDGDFAGAHSHAAYGHRHSLARTHSQSYSRSQNRGRASSDERRFSSSTTAGAPGLQYQHGDDGALANEGRRKRVRINDNDRASSNMRSSVPRDAGARVRDMSGALPEERAGSAGAGAGARAQVHVPRPNAKGDLARTFRDPVDLGICSAEEGRKLVELYVYLILGSRARQRLRTVTLSTDRY